MLYKVWKDSDSDLYVVDTDSMDKAFAEARKRNPQAHTSQACTEKETREIRRMFVFSSNFLIIPNIYAGRYIYWRDL